MITKIGIVGCYGSKKSYVTRIFAEMGIPVFSSDVVTSYFIEHDKKFKANFLQRFSGFSKEYSEINPDNVREFLYKNTQLLMKFRKMINPFVKCYYEKWINGIDSTKNSLIIVEGSNIAGDIYSNVDYTIGVLANDELRRNRLNKYFNLNNEETINLINNDLSDDMYMSKCNYILINDSVAVFTQALEIYNDIYIKLKLSA